MVEEGETGARDAPSPAGAVVVESGTVRETLREILLEIPGFRALAERGVPPRVVAGPPGVGPSGGSPIPVPVPPVGPSEGEGLGIMDVCVLSSFGG